MVLRDGRPGASLSTSTRHEAQRRPLTLKGRRREDVDRVKRRTGKPCTRKSDNPVRRGSGRCPVEQLLGTGFEIEPSVLVRLIARDRSDALDEVENGLGLAAFLGEHRLDDLRRLGLAEAALPQKLGPILVGARDYPVTGLGDAVDEGCGEELAKRVRAGAASWAKREAAYFECRMVISSKSSTPQSLRFWQTARR